MKKSFIVLAAIAGVYSSIVSAGYDVARQINHIHSVAGFTLIKTANVMINPAGCLSNFWYAIPETDPIHDNSSRSAMTALASGKTVTIYVHDTNCVAGYPLVTGLTINR